MSAASRDGYTLLNGTSSYTLNMAMHSANYDFVNDFDPIAMITSESDDLRRLTHELSGPARRDSR